MVTLVHKAQHGDLAAFGDIVRRFKDMACGYAYTVLGDFHLAQDAAQEAFIEAWRCLPNLREPGAFPAWFRRIVYKHCDRQIRKRRITTVSLEKTGEMPAQDTGEEDMKELVLEAIRALPEKQREVTTLFYINGYSQNEVADFLEVPLSTVKKRLYDSRKNLKKRMVDMVKETLHENAADPKFSADVIHKLLHRPKPLEIEGHPVRDIWLSIREALGDYEIIGGKEIVEKSGFEGTSLNQDDAFQLSNGRILRQETTVTTIQAIEGRKPPIKLVTAGRVFRPDKVDASHMQVFHQCDVLRLEKGITNEDMKSTLSNVLECIFGDVKIEWLKEKYRYFDDCMEAQVEFNGSCKGVAGCGMVRKDLLREKGFDPEEVSGFGFGIGLDRVAMIKLGLEDIRMLWQEPFVK